MRDSRERERAEHQARRTLSSGPEEFAIFITKELELLAKRAADIKPE